MKLKRIIPLTILSLALAASIDTAITSCSNNKAPEGWVKNLKINLQDGIKINWSYPETGRDLIINYQIDSSKQISWTAYHTDANQTILRDDVTSRITNVINKKQLVVPAAYVWLHSIEFEINLLIN